jgi:hypothetical protein
MAELPFEYLSLVYPGYFFFRNIVLALKGSTEKENRFPVSDLFFTSHETKRNKEQTNISHGDSNPRSLLLRISLRAQALLHPTPVRSF